MNTIIDNSKGKTFYLNRKTVQLRGGAHTVYFFSLDKRDTYTDEFPEGYQVVESKRTGLLVLKKA